VTAAEDAARLLESLGHIVEESHPAALDDLEVTHHFLLVFSVSTAHLMEMVGGIVGTAIAAGDVEPLNWMIAEAGRGISATQYLATLDWLSAYTRRVAQWWHDDGFDLLLTPTLPEPPPLLGSFKTEPGMEFAAGIRAGALCTFTAPFNITGQPAISLPLYWSGEGLPIGVQLAGPYGREDQLLRIASQLEGARPWAGRRPSVHA
jgi:amidase